MKFDLDGRESRYVMYGLVFEVTHVDVSCSLIES